MNTEHFKIYSHGKFWEFELKNIKDFFVLHQKDRAEVGHKTLPLREKRKEKALQRIKSVNLSPIKHITESIGRRFMAEI